MDIKAGIETRRSVKHYDPHHVMSDAEIEELIRLAKLAPSSFNMQNYRFVLVRDPALRKEIRDGPPLAIVLAGGVRVDASDQAQPKTGRYREAIG